MSQDAAHDFFSFATAGASAAFLASVAAHAAQPVDWQTRFQPPATDIMAQIEWFEVYSLWFIIPITLLVLALLAWCIVRYRASANPSLHDLSASAGWAMLA